MKIVIITLTFSLLVLSGMGMAKNINVQEVENFKVGKLDQMLCKKLAMKYGIDTSSLSLDQLAQLQFCLAHTWGDHADTTPPMAPGDVRLDTQGPSTGNTDIASPQAPVDLMIVE